MLLVEVVVLQLVLVLDPDGFRPLELPFKGLEEIPPTRIPQKALEGAQLRHVAWDCERGSWEFAGEVGRHALRRMVYLGPKLRSVSPEEKE